MFFGRQLSGILPPQLWLERILLKMDCKNLSNFRYEDTWTR
jgi:hypothetical protein